MEKETNQPIIENPPPVEQPKKRSYVIPLLLLILVGAITAAVLFFTVPRKNITSPEGDNVTNDLQKSLASPTPFLFREMTIPGLREREYNSKLGEQTFNYQGSNYTAYLTSYDSDGFKINGLLTIPTGEKPQNGWPAVVFVHGYIPPNQYQTTGAAYHDYVDYIARNGFVVFKIDLRGHGDSEGEPGGAYYSTDYVIDTLNAYSALQNTDLVNPDKIGLWGHSMAGNITFRSLAAKPEIPAVVIWAGAVYSYTDREKYGINDNSYQPSQNASERQRLRQRLADAYGEYDPNHFFWKQFTPTNYISEFKGAIGINHAVDDDVVDVGYSRDLNEILNKTKIPHELNEYQSGGHNISGISFIEAMDNTVAFYKKYLSE